MSSRTNPLNKGVGVANVSANLIHYKSGTGDSYTTVPAYFSEPECRAKRLSQ
jgi:hypothetical protein